MISAWYWSRSSRLVWRTKCCFKTSSKSEIKRLSSCSEIVLCTSSYIGVSWLQPPLDSPSQPPVLLVRSAPNPTTGIAANSNTKIAPVLIFILDSPVGSLAFPSSSKISRPSAANMNHSNKSLCTSFETIWWIQFLWAKGRRCLRVQTVPQWWQIGSIVTSTLRSDLAQ